MKIVLGQRNSHMTDWPFDTLVSVCVCARTDMRGAITYNEVVNELKFIVLLSQNLEVNKLVAFYCSRKSFFLLVRCATQQNTRKISCMPVWWPGPADNVIDPSSFFTHLFGFDTNTWLPTPTFATKLIRAKSRKSVKLKTLFIRTYHPYIHLVSVNVSVV